MGVGFIVVIVFLAGLLGMFARQALANVDAGNQQEYYKTDPSSNEEISEELNHRVDSQVM